MITRDRPDKSESIQQDIKQQMWGFQETVGQKADLKLKRVARILEQFQAQNNYKEKRKETIKSDHEKQSGKDIREAEIYWQWNNAVFDSTSTQTIPTRFDGCIRWFSPRKEINFNTISITHQVNKLFFSS